MSILYKNVVPNLTKKSKLNYFSPSMWRLMYLASTSDVHLVGDKKIKNRSSTVPIALIRRDTMIYTGKKWTFRWINRWMVGFKFGEFTWNRKYALYKAKQMRKKNKKKK